MKRDHQKEVESLTAKYEKRLEKYTRKASCEKCKDAPRMKDLIHMADELTTLREQIYELKQQKRDLQDKV